METDFITLARVVKTQGRVGEVAADLTTDFPERFEQRRRLYALLPDGARRELKLESFWEHKGRLVMKFAGVETISDAEALLGSELQIPAAERAELEPDEVYVSDLVGAEVVEVSGAGASGPRKVGNIADVQFGAGEAPTLVVKDAGGKEFLVPYVEGFIARWDAAAKRLEMRLPEGLLELDAPLTAEEKDRQRQGL